MANTRVTDKGLANFNKAMNELASLRADVGFWGESREDDGARVVDVALWNEYGTETAPSRPFMRNAADSGAEVIMGAILPEARRVIAGASTGRVLLNVAAMRFRDHIKETIRAAPGWAKPNAPATKARKGHGMPLIDSHLMIASVRHRIRTKGKGDTETAQTSGARNSSRSGATVRGGGQYV